MTCLKFEHMVIPQDIWELWNHPSLLYTDKVYGRLYNKEDECITWMYDNNKNTYEYNKIYRRV